MFKEFEFGWKKLYKFKQIWIFIVNVIKYKKVGDKIWSLYMHVIFMEIQISMRNYFKKQKKKNVGYIVLGGDLLPKRGFRVIIQPEF